MMGKDTLMLDVSVAYWDSFLANQGQTMSNPPKADMGRAHFAPVHGVEAPGNVSKLLKEDQVWGAIAIPCSWRKDPAAKLREKKGISTAQQQGWGWANGRT